MFGPVAEPRAGRARRASKLSALALLGLVGAAPGAAASQTIESDQVALAKTVYAGHDGGQRCDGAAGYAEAGPLDPVTYCFSVTNTGTGFLGSITIADPLVAGEPVLVAAESSPLAPGHSALFYLESTPPPDEADGHVDDTYINTATVRADVVDAAGDPVGAEAVTATAEAVVFPAEDSEPPNPAVALVTTVYSGVDGGARCPADKSTIVERDAPATYCFTVTNTGTTHLGSIALADERIPGSPTLLRADSDPLAPGDSAYYYLEFVAPAEAAEGLATASIVTANSVDASGADLVGFAAISNGDSARITSIPPTTPEPEPAPAPPSEPEPAPEPAPAPELDAAAEGETASAAQPEAATEPPPVGDRAEPGPADTRSAEGVEAEVRTPEPAAQAAARYQSQAPTGTDGPSELAHTGWETWVIAALGLVLMAGGWIVLDAPGLRPAPARSEEEPA